MKRQIVPNGPNSEDQPQGGLTPPDDLAFWDGLQAAGRQNFLELWSTLEAYNAWKAIPEAEDRKRVMRLAVAAARQDWSAFRTLLRAKFWKRQNWLKKVRRDAEADRPERERLEPTPSGPGESGGGE